MGFRITKGYVIGMKAMAKEREDGLYDCTACQKKAMTRKQTRKHFMEKHA